MVAEKSSRWVFTLDVFVGNCFYGVSAIIATAMLLKVNNFRKISKIRNQSVEFSQG
jgi:hypothetical protein